LSRLERVGQQRIFTGSNTLCARHSELAWPDGNARISRTRAEGGRHVGRPKIGDRSSRYAVLVSTRFLRGRALRLVAATSSRRNQHNDNEEPSNRVHRRENRMAQHA
jgi:hypothetical protein